MNTKSVSTAANKAAAKKSTKTSASKKGLRLIKSPPTDVDQRVAAATAKKDPLAMRQLFDVLGKDVNQAQYKHKYVEVTPQMAEALLSFGEMNRNCKVPTINKFAEMMSNDQWYPRLSGPLMFHKDTGKRVDGEHRLKALIIADVPVVFDIQFVDNQEWETMGTVAPRTVDDQLSIIYRVTYAAKKRSWYSTCDYLARRGSHRSGSTITAKELHKWICDHQEAIDLAEKMFVRYSGSRSEFIKAPTMGALVFALMHTAPGSKVRNAVVTAADHMFRQLATSKDDPIRRLQDYMIQQSGASRGQSDGRTTVARKVLFALRQRIEKSKCTGLVASDDTIEFFEKLSGKA